MSYAAEQVLKREQDEALREMEIWHSANVIREAFKRGEREAVELVIELKEMK